jgi:radical SAM superfamily enzyme YgiQ (UPF0313 family)
MYNILVINPPNNPFTNKSIIAEPLDVLEIGTIINRRYKVKVLDMDAKEMKNDINDYLVKGKLNILIFIYDYQIPLHTSNTLDNIFEIIHTCKQNIKTIVIGKTASCFHKYLTDNGIDIVIASKAEDRINKVIKNIETYNNLLKIKGLYMNDIYTGDHKVTYNYANNPIPSRNLIDQGDYMSTKTMIASRGCNGACTFCSTPKFFGRWEAKSVNKVIKEIKYLITNYNTKQIMFLDDNFTVDKDRVIKICNRLIKDNINIKLGCLSSVKNYDEDMFKLMYKAGFRWVHMGIESGSAKILKQMNKQMDINNVKQIIKTLKSIGYRIRTSFILDYPNQDDEDFNETLKLLKEIETDEIRLHFLAKRVYTKLFDENSLNNQYIHRNTSDYLSKKELDKLDQLLITLKNKGYFIAREELDWDKIEDNLLKKIISFIPIKYGVNWYD